jgi:hypothetical protein
MKGESEIIEMLKAQGWVTREEAAELCGRVAGGNTDELFQKCSVRCITLDRGTVKRTLYRKDDLKNVPQLFKTEAQQPELMRIPGGANNGGKTMHAFSVRLDELEARVKSMEDFKAKFD